MEERLTEPGDVMLLYLPLAHNYGRLLHLSAAYIGFTIAFLPDPLRAGDGAAARAAARSSRACRASTRRSTRPSSRSSTRRRGARKALIDWALGVGYRVSKLRQAKQPVPRGLAAAAPARRQARLLEGEGAARRPAARRERGRRAALARHRRVLPRDRHPHPRGLRPLRGDDGGDGQPRRATSSSARSASRCPGVEIAHRRGRRDPDPLEHRVRRLLPRRGGDARGARRRRASSTPATSATSTRTASSSSPTARRTSSSRPAARTSRRRTSRTS